jgi:hypothetical protein
MRRFESFASSVAVKHHVGHIGTCTQGCRSEGAGTEFDDPQKKCAVA